MTDFTDDREWPEEYCVDERTGAWCKAPWPTDPDEKRHLISNSLGPLVIRWAENCLTDEEFERFGPGLIDPETGESWRFTDEQRRLIILYYAYDPDTGRWLHRAPVRSTIANDQILTAALTTIEDIGPSRLAWNDGWEGVPRRRCRFPQMLSAVAREWHGVNA
ncbi:hypothetical protein DDJ72_04070 [Mycobacteroides abscessus]|uniref:hypothetical protein n=1 Tax=Mycobacteroides abscessus TaxID=36809 RepID=UPI000D3EA268|nr:hypothetical protein [Mycobacteroides abscessus]PVA58077.1 hypothetical protein DDJ72_04070 [Mycobacteroides abscessus]